MKLDGHDWYPRSKDHREPASPTEWRCVACGLHAPDPMDEKRPCKEAA